MSEKNDTGIPEHSSGNEVGCNDLLAEKDKWQPIETAPKDKPIIMRDEKGFVYPGEYDFGYGRFSRYSYEGLEEHQHAIEWMQFPS